MQNKQLKTVLLAAGGIVGAGAVVGLILGFALAEGKKDEGPVVSTSSGLQYIDQRVGDGPVAKNGDRVQVHYLGTLSDGTKFDASRDRGAPLDYHIGVDPVVEGWKEGIIGMKVGGKRKLLVPAKLGYGAEGRKPSIPPNADLVFEIELLRIL